MKFHNQINIDELNGVFPGLGHYTKSLMEGSDTLLDMATKSPKGHDTELMTANAYAYVNAAVCLTRSVPRLRGDFRKMPKGRTGTVYASWARIINKKAPGLGTAFYQIVLCRDFSKRVSEHKAASGSRHIFNTEVYVYGVVISDIVRMVSGR